MVGHDRFLREPLQRHCDDHTVSCSVCSSGDRGNVPLSMCPWRLHCHLCPLQAHRVGSTTLRCVKQFRHSTRDKAALTMKAPNLNRAAGFFPCSSLGLVLSTCLLPSRDRCCVSREGKGVPGTSCPIGRAHIPTFLAGPGQKLAQLCTHDPCTCTFP